MQVTGKLKSVGKDLYKSTIPQKYCFALFFSTKIQMSTKPFKIAAQIIFMNRQINLNTWNFKIFPYSQEKYKLNMVRYFWGSVLY